MEKYQYDVKQICKNKLPSKILSLKANNNIHDDFFSIDELDSSLKSEIVYSELLLKEKEIVIRVLFSFN
jgi:hypothetical protein